MRKKPSQQRAKLTVASIIEAAERLIAEEGLDALSTYRVAAMAGVTDGTLYQYFYDGADLLESVLEKASQDITEAMGNFVRTDIGITADVQMTAKAGLRAGMAIMRANALYPELARNWHRLPIERLMTPIERYLVNASRHYLHHHFRNQREGNLQARLFVVINSAIFTLLRFLHQDDPFLKEDAVIDMLAEMIASTLGPVTQQEA